MDLLVKLQQKNCMFGPIQVIFAVFSFLVSLETGIPNCHPVLDRPCRVSILANPHLLSGTPIMEVMFEQPIEVGGCQHKQKHAKSLFIVTKQKKVYTHMLYLVSEDWPMVA